nr:recombinase RecA [Streptomonospora litoralis]
MFGCASWDTWVTLSDGTRERIGKIVNQKMDVEVLSYDAELDEVVPRRVTNWFNNGRTEEFLHFKVERAGGGSGNGCANLELTPNHLVRTPGGWREAGDMMPGDRVMLAQHYYLNDTQKQMVLGSLLGDGCLSAPVRKDSESSRFRLGHGAKQEEYLKWKVAMLENIPHSLTSNTKGAVFADFTPLAELGELRQTVYLGDGKKHITWDYLKSLTPLALAVWYMDDGSFDLRTEGRQARTEGGSGRIEICLEAMSPGSRQRIADYLRDTFEFDVKLSQRGARKVAFLTFTAESSKKFLELIAPYVHPSMDYKLLPGMRGHFDIEPVLSDPVLRPSPAVVRSITPKAPTAGRTGRYDIEVEGSHNYFADGVMVHNSPETTTGGRALKFYSSVRLDVRRIETLKDGQDAVGNRTRVKVVKNKVAPPFKQAEFDILYGVGISREGGLIDLGVEQGVVRKSGAWYTYEGTQLGQGKENARNFLRENVDMANEVEKKIKEKLGVPGAGDDSSDSSDATGAKAADTKAAPDAKTASAKEAGAKEAGAKDTAGKESDSAATAAAPAKRASRTKSTPPADA